MFLKIIKLDNVTPSNTKHWLAQVWKNVCTCICSSPRFPEICWSWCRMRVVSPGGGEMEDDVSAPHSFHSLQFPVPKRISSLYWRFLKFPQPFKVLLVLSQPFWNSSQIFPREVIMSQGSEKALIDVASCNVFQRTVTKFDHFQTICDFFRKFETSWSLHQFSTLLAIKESQMWCTHFWLHTRGDTSYYITWWLKCYIN